MSDATTYPNADLVALCGDERHAGFEEGYAYAEAVTWARAQRTARGLGFCLPDLHELDSPGRGDGAPVSAPEPSPSLTPPATAVNDAAGTPPGQ